MIRKAIKCDRDGCSAVDFLDSDQYDKYLNEGTADGWIRMFINNPYNYSWDRKKSQVFAQGWYDICSITCATDVLYSARLDLR